MEAIPDCARWYSHRMAFAKSQTESAELSNESKLFLSQRVIIYNQLTEERLQPGFFGSCYQGFNSTAEAWTASEWDGNSGAVLILQEANELKKKVSEELYQLNRAIV